MATTLYRKYRPHSFKDLVNQNHVKITLQNEIETGKIAHAYLFTGPRGIGKTTTARIFAKAINCEKRKEGQSEPCNKCDACNEINNSKALDIVEIDAASHTGVDNVRENIINNTRFTPARLKYKVFIIDEVHMLSISAFNALLKTLEEPPEYVVFILATTEIHKVPTTIISRCQRFDFKKIDQHDLVERLRYVSKQEEASVDNEVLQRIAKYSEGCLRDAESLLGQVLSLGEKKISTEQIELFVPRSNFEKVSELVEYLSKKDSARALSLVNKLLDEGINISQFAEDIIEFLRKLLLTRISSNLEEFSWELDKRSEEEIYKLARSFKVRELIKMVELFVQRRQELKYSPIIQLPLELAIVEICGESYKGERKEIQSEDKDDDDDKKSSVPIEDTETEKKEESKKESLKSEIVEDNKKTKNISLKQIEKKWGKVLKCVREHNHSLATFLRTSMPFDIEDGVLKIALKYKFHKELIEEPANLDILYKSLKEVFGQKILVKFIIDEGAKPLDIPEEKKESEKMINSALAEFGGKLVD